MIGLKRLIPALLFLLVSDPALSQSWTGKGCNILEGQELELLGSIDIPVTCRSSRFPVRPGHHEGSISIRPKDQKNLSLPEDLKIRLRIFDSDEDEISLDQPMSRNKYVDSGNLLGSIEISSPVKNEWTKITFLSRRYPFDAGWLPKKTAWGELEVSSTRNVLMKDLELNFSRWNMPLKKRIELYVDKEAPQIYPPPQYLKHGEGSVLVATPELNPICVSSIPEEAELGLRKFEEALDAFGISIPLRKNTCKESKVTLRINKISTEKESYNLNSRVLDNGAAVITLEANEPRGFYYGFDTLRQLISATDERTLSIPEVEVKDYPRTNFRAVSGSDPFSRKFRYEIAATKWLADLRLNTFIFDPHVQSLRWWYPTSDTTAAAAIIGEEARRTKLYNPAISLNFYTHNADPSLEAPIVFSRPGETARIINSIDHFRKLGFGSVILRTDDYTPSVGNKFDYGLTDAADLAKYGSLGRAHAELISKLAERVKEPIYFVPPWYNSTFVSESENLARAYFQDVCRNLPKNAHMMWTGPVVRSLKIDAPDINAFSELCGGRVPTLWDNTTFARRHQDFWLAYPHRRKLLSFLEPFSVDMPESQLKAGVYLSAQVTELFRIQLATAAAYLWNPEQYQPERVLWSYLVDRFGRKAAEKIIDFDAIYWELESLVEDDSEISDSRRFSSLERELKASLYELQDQLKRANGDLLDEFQNKYLIITKKKEQAP